MESPAPSTPQFILEAISFIAESGYDRSFGARPLKRYIQRKVETQLGRAMIAGTIQDGSTVRVEVKDGGLAFGAEGKLLESERTVH